MKGNLREHLVNTKVNISFNSFKNQEMLGRSLGTFSERDKESVV